MNQELFIKLAEGNPGALNVCIQLYQQFGEDILVSLDNQNVRGPNIWLLFKDECGEDLSVTAAVIQAGTAYATISGNPYLKS